jgi:hypothetical protein
MFYHAEYAIKKREFADICQHWMEMTEDTRKKVHKKNKLEEKIWLTSMVKGRVPTGYQLFLKSERFTQRNPLSFGSRITAAAHKWQNLCTSEKNIFVDKSKQLKKERTQFLQNLPKFKKKKYQEELKKFKRQIKEKRPSKPCNVFMLYLKDRWNDEQRLSSGVGYRSLMKTASHNWKQVLTVADKRPYRIQFDHLKQVYEQTKKNGAPFCTDQVDLNSDSE